ncbi:hypothetical protein D3C87_1345920 [compost metagenome]
MNGACGTIDQRTACFLPFASIRIKELITLYCAPAKLRVQGAVASHSTYFCASGYSFKKAATRAGSGMPVAEVGLYASICFRKPSASRVAKKGSLLSFILHCSPSSAVSIAAILTVRVELSGA